MFQFRQVFRACLLIAAGAAQAQPAQKQQPYIAAQLKSVNAFVESLKAGEASAVCPLFVAARYLLLAERSRGALVLDADLRLEGLSVMRDSLFRGIRPRPAA